MLRALLPVVVALAVIPAAVADVFDLTNGGTIEGELVADENDSYTIRTVVGIVRIRREMVEKIRPAPSPFAEYDRRTAALPDTADAHVELAEWCVERGLYTQREKHLRRAVELDPNHAAARAALGHVRVGSLWVDGRTAARRAESPPTEPSGPPEDEAQVARAIEFEWNRRIRAIKSTYLDATLDRLNEEGRKRILEIRDPLAILPLARNLGRGNLEQRKLLLEALKQFDEDEATMNLAVMALVDRNPEIRAAVLSELVRRRDDRVPGQFRKALASSSDAMVRRAATALAALDVKEAVPDLIDALTARARRMVEVPVRTYFGEMATVFNNHTSVELAPGRRLRRAPEIGIVNAYGTVSVETERRMRNVTLLRSEVREALRKLTGEDFGFETGQWRRWYEENVQ